MNVIHCLHNQRPSVFYRFRQSLDDYIVHRHGTDVDFPDNRAMLEAILNCKFVFGSGGVVDEDRHFWFKPWRNAIYCEGTPEAVKEIVMFVDGFVHWYSTIREGGKEDFPDAVLLRIEVPDAFHIDFDEAIEQGEPPQVDCQFSMKTYKDDASARVTDTPPPCYPARLLVATIGGASKNTVSIVWSGNA